MVRLGTFLTALLLPLALLAPASASPPGGTSFTNPVTAGTVDTFPDPSAIRGDDGWWYAYGTTNPILNSAGETGEHVLPELRSRDLTHWQHVGDAIDVDAQPAWWPAGTRAWAPDVRVIDGEYHLYYALSTGGVALLTGPTPTGPWTDRGLVLPAQTDCPTGTIDQAVFTDSAGQHWLYWGSYDTLCVAPMNADATAVTGAATQIGHGKRMEGGYVVEHGDRYYLFYSDGSCCDGEFSGYQVKVARASSPTGPFLTPDGEPLTDLTSHGGVVLAANGNGIDGPGHNAVVTDVSGQDWMVYHGIPEDDPDFPAVTGANGAELRLTKRPMLIDRMDWVHGWPVVNGGRGPAVTRTAAPVTTYLKGSTVADGTLGHGTRLSARSVAGDVRVEAHVAGEGGLVVGDTTAVLRSGRLVVTRGRVTRSAALPAGWDTSAGQWLVAERRGRTLSVEVSSDRLHEPVASVRLTGVARSGRVGVAAPSGAVRFTSVGAARLATSSTRAPRSARLGRLLPAYSDEFADAAPSAAWSWVRGGDTPPASVADGSLVWPTQAGDLTGTTNTASVLLRDAPASDFTVETQLTFDGTKVNQQAGLVLYDTDDRYVALDHVVLGMDHTNQLLHVTRALKEGPRPTYSLPTPVFDGPMFGGPAGSTTWLRLAYHRAGERRDVRMSTSTDGVHWTAGGVWTLPVVDGRPLQIGLVSMGGTGATARFGYVRTYAGS